MLRNTLKNLNPSLISRLVKYNAQGYKHFSTSSFKKEKAYTNSGEWLVKVNDYYKIGLTENSASELGELVYLEFDKDIGELVGDEEDLVIIESVKASASVLAPFDCKVIGHNNKLIDDLEIINKNPECEDSSWIIKVRKS